MPTLSGSQTSFRTWRSLALLDLMVFVCHAQSCEKQAASEESFILSWARVHVAHTSLCQCPMTTLISAECCRLLTLFAPEQGLLAAADLWCAMGEGCGRGAAGRQDDNRKRQRMG